MCRDDFESTTVGREYISGGQSRSVDEMLEYLHALITANYNGMYDKEINATKCILKIMTQ